MYVSCNIMFVETLEISRHMTIQVDRQVYESEKASINNVEAKPENKSEAKDLVVEGNNAK